MGTMDLIVAPISNVKFDIEVALEQQLGAQPLPFPGMDSNETLHYISTLSRIIIFESVLS